MSYRNYRRTSTKKTAKAYQKPTKLPASFVVVDFETTGLSPERHQVIQIGAVKYENGQQVSTYSSYINPFEALSDTIVRITGITDEILATAPAVEDVWPDFLAYIAGYTIVAHNASFDMKFLLATSCDLRLEEVTYHVLDTVPLARKYFDTPNHKLETLKNHLGLDNQSHDALEDCIVTGKVYMMCWQKTPERGRSGTLGKAAVIPQKASTDSFSEDELRLYQSLNVFLQGQRMASFFAVKHVGKTFSLEGYFTFARITCNSKSQFISLRGNQETFTIAYPNAIIQAAPKSDWGTFRVTITHLADVLIYRDFLIDCYLRNVTRLKREIDAQKIVEQDWRKYQLLKQQVDEAAGNR
ncbi:exonuclease domain-containing protein [Brochothrix campestris]|uniref:DNA polymerase III subunit epsilon n=1 Tax=Brochothrix campestris FSL F6-1037 TaxID=1265861 RepID=W7CCR5_9LIST|nr:exonuclease domain-containing protein [Brochothrix campestris]EUJ37119.1 DNA polymerase III subunit epsilon [Brochothrix campestris FSL F6-1037]